MCVWLAWCVSPFLQMIWTVNVCVCVMDKRLCVCVCVACVSPFFQITWMDVYVGLCTSKCVCVCVCVGFRRIIQGMDTYLRWAG